MSDIAKEFPDHPKLGRKFAEFDERSRGFAAVGPLAADDAPLKSRTWRRTPRVYDQGESSQCVAYSAKGAANSTPISKSIKSSVRRNLSTDEIYKLAQTLDPWDGEDYDGTSVLAGAKALKQLGVISEYRWCFGLDDVLKTLSSYGPVVIGVSWYDSMFHPDAKGNLTVDTSRLAGGHAIELLGLDVKNETVVIANSWGTSWGDRGRCYLKWTDLDMLLKDHGEAVTYQTT